MRAPTLAIAAILTLVGHASATSFLLEVLFSSSTHQDNIPPTDVVKLTDLENLNVASEFVGSFFGFKFCRDPTQGCPVHFSPTSNGFNPFTAKLSLDEGGCTHVDFGEAFGLKEGICCTPPPCVIEV